MFFYKIYRDGTKTCACLDTSRLANASPKDKHTHTDKLNYTKTKNPFSQNKTASKMRGWQGMNPLCQTLSYFFYDAVFLYLLLFFAFWLVVVA